MDDNRDRRAGPPLDGPETGPISSLDPDSVRGLVSRSGVRGPDVEDVAQDALMEIWQRGETTVTGMVVVRMAKAAARKHRRRAQREALTPDGDLDLQDERPDPEARAIERSLVSVLWHVLLPRVHPRRRRVLVGHAIEEASLAEIAAREGITEEAAKKRLQSAKKEIGVVKERVQAEQRRRRRPVRPALLPPIRDLAPLRGRRPLLCRKGFKRVALAVLAGAIVASYLVPMTDAALRAVARSPVIVPLAVPEAALTESGSGSSAAEVPATTYAAPAPTIADSSASSKPIRDFEHNIIQRVRSALDLGGPANVAEALALLRFHQREFTHGRLAAEREALLRRILTPDDAARGR